MNLFHSRNHASRMRRILLEKLKNTPDVAIFTRYERQILENTTELHMMIPDLEISFTSSQVWSNADFALQLHGARPVYFAPLESQGMIEFVGIVTQIILYPDRYPPPEYAKRQVDIEEKDKTMIKPEVNTMYAVTHCQTIDTPFHLSELCHFINDENLDAQNIQSFATVYTKKW